MTLHFSPLLLNRYFSTSSVSTVLGFYKRGIPWRLYGLQTDRLYKPGVTGSYLWKKHKRWEKMTSLFTIEHGEEVIRQIPFLNLILWCPQHLSAQKTFFPSLSCCAQCPPASLWPDPSQGLPSCIDRQLLGSIKHSGNFGFKPSSVELQIL